jgi:hypothetical protein
MRTENFSNFRSPGPLETYGGEARSVKSSPSYHEKQHRAADSPPVASRVSKFR